MAGGIPPLTKAEAEATLALVREHGSAAAAARAVGMSERTLRWRAQKATEILADPVFVDAAQRVGAGDVRNISAMWKMDKDENGNGVSVYLKNPMSGEFMPLVDLVRDTIDSIATAKPVRMPKRDRGLKKQNLLVIDTADVHFRKLCVATETGYTYNRDIARGRVVEGVKSLLKKASGAEIGRVLFVLGNDVLHTDNAQSTTTSGTRQDVEGSLFEGFRDAGAAYSEAIRECREVADVDLLHCMSNHDWTHGWMLSQTIAAGFRGDPHVRASDYNMSEIHRKYYRFGDNLMGFTHGDGAKEEKLMGLMLQEARKHVSECPFLYWYLHHVHHKDRKRRDGDRPILREKDHTGMTAVVSGRAAYQGGHVDIEYVRSPSPPDGWHDRNGFVNRQGVEAFVHTPREGSEARFTTWF